MTETFTCPVCGWPDLAERPTHSFEICPACGTEFGNSDWEVGHDVLRNEWIEKGMPFRFPDEEPADWNPVEQLRAAGLPTDVS